MSYTHILQNTNERDSGRTTRLAIHFVQQALDNPGKWINVEDHGPSMQADRMLFVLVCNVLDALRVRFEANRARNSLVCHYPYAGPPPYPSPWECEQAYRTELFEERIRSQRIYKNTRP